MLTQPSTELLIQQLQPFNQIIFDLDNTLFDQRDYDRGAFEDIEQKLMQLLPANNMNGLALFLLMHKQKKGANYGYLFNDALTHYQLPNHFLKVFINLYYQHNGHYIKPCHSLISTLAEQLPQQQFFIVTNGPTKVQQTKIAKLQLNKYVNDIVICDPKFPETLKPNKYAFTLLKKRHKLSHCVMVGDSIATDGKFAQQINIPFIYFNYVKANYKNENK